MAEAKFRDTQEAVRGARDALARCEQERRVQTTRREHADKLLQQLESRSARLEQERAALVAPDDAMLSGLRTELTSIEHELQQLREALAPPQGVAALEQLEQLLRRPRRQ